MPVAYRGGAPNVRQAWGVRDVAHEDYSASVRQRLETVAGRRLIDAHRCRPARLHRAVRTISRLLGPGWDGEHHSGEQRPECRAPAYLRAIAHYTASFGVSLGGSVGQRPTPRWNESLTSRNMVDLETLTRAPLIGNLSLAARRVLATKAVVRRYSSGAALWRAGQHVNSMAIVLDGQVRVVREG